MAENLSEQDLRKRVQQLEMLRGIDREINSSPTLYHALQLILERGLEIIHCDRGDITLLDEDTGELVLECAIGPTTEFIPDRRDIKDGISGRAVREKRTQCVEDIRNDPDYQLLFEKAKGTRYAKFLEEIQSTIKIPLMVKDKVLGLFCAHKPIRGGFNPDDVKLLEELIRSAALVVQHVHRHEDNSRKLHQSILNTSALSAIKDLIITSTDPGKLRDKIYDGIAEDTIVLTGAKQSSIRMFDEDRRIFSFVAGRGPGWTEEMLALEYKIDDCSAAAWVAKNCKSYLVPDVSRAEYFVRLWKDTKSHLSVPLIYRKRLIGLISVDSDQHNAFTHEHVRLLSLLAIKTVIALRYVELCERSSLFKLEKILSESNDLDVLSPKVVEEVCKIVWGKGCSLFLFDGDTEEFVLQATTGLKQTQDARIAYQPGEGLTGWVAKHSEPLLVNDCADEEELRNIAPDLKWENKYTEYLKRPSGKMRYLAAPLLSDKTTIGVIRVAGKTDDSEFTEADKRLLMAAGSRIAIAIENIWLFHATQRSAAELHTLQEIDREFMQTLNRDKVLNLVLQRGLDLVNCNCGHIRLMDRTSDSLVLAKVIGPDDYHPVKVRKIGEGVSGWVAEHNSPLIIDDVLTDSSYKRLIDLEIVPDYIRSQISIPLAIRGDVLGTFNVHKNVIKGFTSGDIRLLNNLAGRAAIAIQNAELYREIEDDLKKRIEQLAAAEKNLHNKISQLESLRTVDKMFISTLDLKVVLENVLKSINSPFGLICLTDGNQLRLAESYGYLESEIEQVIPIGEGPSGKAAISREPVIIQDTTQSEEYNQFLQRWLGTPYGDFLKSIKSIISIPLILKEDIIGVFTAYKDVANGFKTQDVELLNLLADRIAIATHNAQLYSEVKKKAEGLSLLLETGQVLSQTIDRLEILNKVAEVATNAMEADTCTVWLLNKDEKRIVLEAAYGPHKEWVRQHWYELGEGLTGYTVQTGEVIRIDKACEHPKFLEKFNSQVYGSTCGQNPLMCLPLVINKEVIGVIKFARIKNAPDAEPPCFTKEDESIGKILAGQISAALETAEKQAQLLFADKMSSLGGIAAGVAHEVNTPLNNVLQTAERMSHKIKEPKLCEMLNTIMGEARRGGEIARSLLQFARKPAGVITSCRIEQLILDVLRFLQKVLENDNIEVNINIPSDMPAIMVDESEIKQVIFNLIDNAKLAMRENGGKLTISARELDDGRKIEIAFSDTGVGIPPEMLDRIFEPFFTTKEVGQGTGLGLAVSMGIVQKHRGSITVKSILGKGSTFVVSLPIYRENENE